MKSLEKYKKMEVELEKLQENAAKELKEGIIQSIKTLMLNYPKIVAIKWKQYTPYFNDGDACVFTVGYVQYKTEDMTDEDGDYGDGFDEWYDGKEQRKKLGDDLSTKLNKLQKNLQDNEKLLEVAFGNHVEIIITPKEVIVDEYEHD